MATLIRRYCVQLPGTWSDAVAELAWRNKRTITQQIQASLARDLKAEGIAVPRTTSGPGPGRPKKRS